MSAMAASSADITSVGLSGPGGGVAGAAGPGGAGGKAAKRRPSMAKALVILGLSKKSNSASNLTMGKRFGFARSEEYGVMPELRNRNLSPPASDGGASQDEKITKPK